MDKEKIKEIEDKAKKLCDYETADCQFFIGGFVQGYIQCLKDLGKYEDVLEQN